jgi:hypothetical protein
MISLNRVGYWGSNSGSLAVFGVMRRASSFCLPADVITVTPHAIFERVQPARAALNDAGLC